MALAAGWAAEWCARVYQETPLPPLHRFLEELTGGAAPEPAPVKPPEDLQRRFQRLHALLGGAT